MIEMTKRIKLTNKENKNESLQDILKQRSWEINDATSV